MGFDRQEPPVQRFRREHHLPVRHPLDVPGQHRPQHQLGAVARLEGNRRHEGGESLARGPHQLSGDARDLQQALEGRLVPEVALHLVGGHNRRGARGVAQQRDLSDQAFRQKRHERVPSLSVCRTSTSPDAMMKNDVAFSPWRISTSPAGARTGVNSSASADSSSVGIPANTGSEPSSVATRHRVGPSAECCRRYLPKISLSSKGCRLLFGCAADLTHFSPC